ncbi:MAG: metallophosphoesterase family protein, partial [Nitrospirota bacterium]
DALSESGLFDLIIYGHTHRPDVRKANKTTIVNPGKASRLIRGKMTVAIIDLNTMEVEISELR